MKNMFLNISEIDKCADGRSGCEHNCTNFNGSYVCSCMPGFSLETDKHSCNGKLSYNANVFVSKHDLVKNMFCGGRYR